MNMPVKRQTHRNMFFQFARCCKELITHFTLEIIPSGKSISCVGFNLGTARMLFTVQKRIGWFAASQMLRQSVRLDASILHFSIILVTLDTLSVRETAFSYIIFML